MVKIDFKDRILQNSALANRYMLNPVSGQSNTYDITPAQGTVAQEGTPVRALELNQMQINAENAIIANLAAQVPTIAGSTTTRDLTVPAEANKNRLTILLSSAVTATSNIRLRVGTGTYYNLIWPKSGTTNILSLLANTPYDLVFNGSAWIVKDYIETGSNANGNYIKYADGRMVQYGRASRAYAINVVEGSIYTSPQNQTIITFPIAFYNSDIITAVGTTYGAFKRIDSPSATGFSPQFWHTSSVVSSTATISWSSIGRWY